MKVLVAGSSGQLGAEICRQLSGTHSVTGLDAAPGPRRTARSSSSRWPGWTR
ncbi:MAG TPA: hypothetical protein VF815_06995 [Myxococcaceae bacterium]